MLKNVCGQYGHRTLKLAVSLEWIDEMKLFIACRCKFRKAKSWFNDFSVGVLKNEHGYLVNETVKSAVSKE